MVWWCHRHDSVFAAVHFQCMLDEVAALACEAPRDWRGVCVCVGGGGRHEKADPDAAPPASWHTDRSFIF